MEGRIVTAIVDFITPYHMILSLGHLYLFSIPIYLPLDGI